MSEPDNLFYVQQAIFDALPDSVKNLDSEDEEWDSEDAVVDGDEIVWNLSDGHTYRILVQDDGESEPEPPYNPGPPKRKIKKQ